MTVKIAFYDAKSYDREFFQRQNRETGFQLAFFDTHLKSDTVNLCQGFDVVCVFVNDVVDAAVVDKLVACGVRLVALRCAGYNNVDLQATAGRLTVVRVPGYSPHAVAEHAAALILTLNRHTHKAYHRTRDGNFAIGGLLGFDLYGKVAGVIGAGQIGRCFIDIARGFGMQVLAYDPFVTSQSGADNGVRFTSLEDIYQHADIISLHCPLNESTHHMIDAGAIATMKDGVMIINTGRGKLIDTQALIQGLKSRRVGAAGLDVYEEEADYFFEDRSMDPIADDVLARLLTFPNVLITSHQGFFTREALINIATTTLNNIRSFFDGAALENEVAAPDR